MRRAAIEPDVTVEPAKPVDDAAGPHASRSAALGADHRAVITDLAPEYQQRAPQLGVQRNGATAALFGGVVVQLDPLAEPSVGIEHHGPAQLGYLAGPQSGFQ